VDRGEGPPSPVPGARFANGVPDLRHAAITELAEMGVADHALESITGHLREGCWSTIRTSASTQRRARSIVSTSRQSRPIKATK
jgi:hypothetical protein